MRGYFIWHVSYNRLVELMKDALLHVAVEGIELTLFYYFN